MGISGSARRFRRARRVFVSWLALLVTTGANQAYAADTDCIEDGGRAVCTSPYPTPFSYGLCDEAGAWAYRMAAWCVVSGGTWYGIYTGCSGGTPTDESNIRERSQKFAEHIYGDSCSITSDTGWGATFDSWNCWSFAGGTYDAGYLIRDGRSLSIKCSKGGAETIRARRDRALECPTGYVQRSTARGTACVRPLEPCDGCGTDGVGNPITPSSGVKIESALDYTSSSALAFARHYHSFRFTEPHTKTVGGHSENRLGSVWRTSFDKRIVPITGSTYAKAALSMPNGEVQYFDASGNEILNTRSGGATLVTTANGYFLNGPNGTEAYDTEGRLKSITYRNGETLTLSYSDGTTGPGGGFVVDANGIATTIALPPKMLTRISDAFGNALALSYDAGGRIVVMTAPADKKTIYGYDARGNLASVKYPDGAIRKYGYNQAPTSTNWPAARHALTSIVDELGNAFGSYVYGADGRAIRSEHTGGVGLVQLTYGAGTTNVTDALGTTRTFTFQSVGGVSRFKSTSALGGSGYGAGVKDRSFDAKGNVTSETQFNGTKTCFGYDSRDLETVRVLGVDAAADCALLVADAATLPAGTVKHVTEWHARWQQPTRTARPGRIVSYVFNGDALAGGGTASCAPADALIADGATGQPIGVVCQLVMQATLDRSDGKDGLAAAADGVPRVFSYTYDAYGRVLTEDGPRTDVSDVTTFGYYPIDDAEPTKRGRLATVTNPLGHVTEITAYNADGAPVAIVDPNGVATTFTYDLRGRVLSRSTDGAKTEYLYDPVGQLVRSIAPDGSTLDYAYDAAHRLKEVLDAKGNRVAYTYDPASELVGTTIFDAAAQTIRTFSREFNALGQLVNQKDSAGNATTYAYDAAGQLQTVTDPVGRQVTSAYDTLGRIKALTVGGTAERSVAYDGQGAVTGFTDGRGLSTATVFDGFQQALSVTSPDTGASTFTYDAAGNLTKRVDALGQATALTYDALNRLTKIVAHDGATSELAYDQGTNGKGRLTLLTDAAGTRAFFYDARGRLVREERGVAFPAATTTLVTQYAYDAADRVASLTYPSGMVVTYARDVLGHVTDVTAKIGGADVAVASALTHSAAGELTGGVGAFGAPLSWTFDKDGRLASYASGLETRTLSYDASGLLTGVSGSSGPAFSYAYDDRGRVKSGSGPTGAFAYAFDDANNMTKRDAAGAVTDLVVSSTSNRLEGATGAMTATYTYNAAGNLVGDGTRTLAYDGLGRLVEVSTGSAHVRYLIDTFGQRVGRLAE